MIEKVRGPSQRKGRAKLANPLEVLGWTCTRAGRWIDPVDGMSRTADEAWGKIYERDERGPIPASTRLIEGDHDDDYEKD